MPEPSDVPVDISVPPTAAVPQPQPLKFRHFSEPAPAGYMKLSEALNLIGSRSYPKEWGLLTEWKQMPFKKDTEGEGFVQLVLKYRGNKRIRSGKRVESNGSDRILRNHVRVYSKTFEKLSHEVISGTVKAYSAGLIDGFQRIDSEMWGIQRSDIEYDGRFAFRINKNQTELCPIYIEVAGFNNMFGIFRLKLGRNMLKKVAIIACQEAELCLCWPTKDKLRQKLIEVFNSCETKLSQYAFDRKIWNNVPMKSPGRPKDSAICDEAGYDRIGARVKTFLDDLKPNSSSTPNVDS